MTENLTTSQPLGLVDLAKRRASIEGMTLSEYIGQLVLADARSKGIKIKVEKRNPKGRPKK